MGDRNAKVGRDNSGSKSVGKFTVGTTNASGERLINLIEGKNLKLVASFFKMKPPKK